MTRQRNNVVLSGNPEGRPLAFVHGFGCDQTMWKQVAPAFADSHCIVSYDLTGMGKSDLSAYDPKRYGQLQAHADDLVNILDDQGFADAVLIGHSVGATIALLAANQRPETVSQLVLVSPSPCFLDVGSYHGGFPPSDLEELVAFLDENHLGWSQTMAPTIAGQPAGDPATEELTQSFCRTDPEIASHFGRVTFFSDHRADFERAARPALILHCNDDALVPMEVAEWMRARVPGSRLSVLDATGHCPHMTVPQQVISEIRPCLGLG